MKRVIMAIALAAVGLCACGGTSNTGAAATAATTQAQAIKVEIISEKVVKYKDSLGNPNAVYIAEIKNTGSKAVKLGNVSVDLEGTDGKIINTTSLVSVYPNVINPGQSAYICESVLSFGQKIALDQIGNAVLHYDVDETEAAEAPAVEVTELSITEEYGEAKIIGRVENKSGKDLTNLYLAAPVIDKSGELKTFVFTIVDSLKSGEKRGFEMHDIFGEPDADYTDCTYSVFAYTRG